MSGKGRGRNNQGCGRGSYGRGSTQGTRHETPVEI
jgi:hypothetical protein